MARFASGRRPYELRSSPINSREAKNRVERNSSPVDKASKFSAPVKSYFFGVDTPHRAVLVPIIQNLRRLPSRARLASMPILKERQYVGVGVGDILGRKRKRVASGTENNKYGSLGNRRAGGRQFKRSRRTSDAEETMSEEEEDAEEEEETNIMEVDEDDEDGHGQTSDEYYLNQAPQWRLNQLRKDELQRLYSLANPASDMDPDITKPNLVQAILDSRESDAVVPPGSPPLTASDEEDDRVGSPIGLRRNVIPMPLRRRATDNIIHATPLRPALRGMKDRSFSLQLFGHNAQKSLHAVNEAIAKRTRKRAGSSISSNEEVEAITPRTPPLPLRRKGTGKGKQVDFEPVAIVAGSDPEEDELVESDAPRSGSVYQPSPRRLRSRDRRTAHQEDLLEYRRIAPMRRAKLMVGNLAEDEDGGRADTLENEQEEETTSNSEGEESDLTELNSEPPTPGPRSKRSSRIKSSDTATIPETPLKERLRRRRGRDTSEEPTTTDMEADSESVESNTESSEEETADEDEEEEEEMEVEVPTEPRRLRNGKIVGEHDGDTEDADDEDAEGEEDEIEQEVSTEVESGEEELEELEEDELEDDSADDIDVDLESSTAKTLARLRRDDLVKLCESRDLSAAGTKMQLAKSLIGWRDRQSKSSTMSSSSAASSSGTTSSTSTARPNSVTRRRGSGKKVANGNGHVPPVLLRSDRIQADQPDTPTPKTAVVQEDPGYGIQIPPANGEGELELDLESLGLEDREIPPDKLQKLEKIGSGGFKDVFVGKLRNRVKVAIAEFRGQLTPMDIKELKLLSDFDHPNVVRFLGVSIPENTKETPVMIVSELCTNGDLFDYVRNVPPLSLHRTISLMLDIASGLEYLHLHKPSIIHRDCKSSNILITSKITAKITDFGLAKVKQSTRSMVRSLVGTVNWQAPELWSPHPKYNHKVDVYSCAMVFWEMLQWHNPTKKYPWEGLNEHAIYDCVGAKKQRPSISGLKKLWCPEIVELMEHMWSQDPQDRPTMSEVVAELKRLRDEY